MLNKKEQEIIVKLYEKLLEDRSKAKEIFKSYGWYKEYVKYDDGETVKVPQHIKNLVKNVDYLSIPSTYKDILKFGVIDKYRMGQAIKNLVKHNLIVINRGFKTSELLPIQQRLLKNIRKGEKNMIKNKPKDLDKGFEFLYKKNSFPGSDLVNPKIKFVSLTPDGKFLAEILKKGD